MHFNLASIVAFAASAMALTVTNPAQGDKVDFSKPVDIKWRSVQNDPKNITLELVNMNGQPNVNKQIAEGVKVSDGHYKVDKLWGIPVAEGYQINILSEEERNTGILAQSQQFNVTRVADPPKTTTSSHASATETAPAATSSTAGSASLAVPAAGSLAMGLLALIV
ncbi:Ser-Thr-rich glycosyl-phosphatidyl-inositol-anchored membrane family-domain-containing protein [Aspergillus floccosus]